MAKSSYLGGWQILFTPATFLPFIIGAVALGVLGNAAYNLLTNLIGAGNYAVIGIGLGALAVIAGSGHILNKVLYDWRQSPPLAGKKQPEQRKGLIILVSNEAVCRKAIEYHKTILSRCWLFCSDKSQAVAEKLKAEFENESTEFQVIKIHDEQVFEPILFKEKVENIYENLPEYFTENDVILDFTGMTVVASVGAVLGCLNEKRSIQYTPAEFGTGLNAIKALEPIEIELEWAHHQPEGK